LGRSDGKKYCRTELRERDRPMRKPKSPWFHESS
jgi:hypothetical protein